MACSGNGAEACGGPNRLTLFTSGGTPPPDPVHNPGPAGWAWQGCYAYVYFVCRQVDRLHAFFFLDF